MTTAAITVLVVRYGLVLLFLPFSALDKNFGFPRAVKQAQQMFKPRPIAIAAILIGLCVEIVCTLGVVPGIADRACALVIAGYCAATAVLYKQFWAQGDFWSDPDGKGRTLLWDFLKNLSLGAGFLLIVVGTDGAGLAPFLHAPFASSVFTVQPVGWVGDWHENPAPQWIVVLSGRRWIESMDGMRIEQGPGEFSFGEVQGCIETDGRKSHKSGTMGDEPCCLMTVQLHVAPKRAPCHLT